MQNIHTHLKDLPGHTQLKRRAREEPTSTTQVPNANNNAKKDVADAPIFNPNNNNNTEDLDADVGVAEETKHPSSKPPTNSANIIANNKKQVDSSALDDIDEDVDVDVVTSDKSDNNQKVTQNNNDDDDEDEDLEAALASLREDKNTNKPTPTNVNTSQQQQQQQQVKVNSTQNLAAVVSTRGYDDDVPFRFQHQPLKTGATTTTAKQVNNADGDNKKEKMKTLLDDSMGNQMNQKFLRRFFR